MRYFKILSTTRNTKRNKVLVFRLQKLHKSGLKHVRWSPKTNSTTFPSRNKIFFAGLLIILTLEENSHHFSWNFFVSGVMRYNIFQFIRFWISRRKPFTPNIFFRQAQDRRRRKKKTRLKVYQEIPAVWLMGEWKPGDFIHQMEWRSIILFFCLVIPQNFST